MDIYLTWRTVTGNVKKRVEGLKTSSLTADPVIFKKVMR